MKLGLFGGSFDPPHLGHVMVTAWALSCTELDGVLCVPTWSHAFDKQHGASFAQRIQMCTLAFEHFKGVQVSDIEKELGEPSRTLTTLQALTAQRPEASFRLLVGADVLPKTDRWYRWDDIIAIAPPIVIGRQDYPLPKACPVELPNVSSTDIRKRLNTTASIQGLVPTSVIEFIRSQGLYTAP